MIDLRNISVQFGGKFLFSDISFTIKASDRIGLVGKNGAGKSTLLKVLIGELRADEGQISSASQSSIGYLPQEVVFQGNDTIYVEACKAFEEILQLEQDLEDINQQIAAFTDYDSPKYYKLLEDLSNKQDRFDRLGGTKIEEEVSKVLKGLGFLHSDFERPMNEFSGGWKMRVELAKILLRQPDFILLDEPTNHLDIEAIIWLEEYLRTYPGGIMMISHDRAFLDKVTNRTIEIVSGKIYDYKASYSEFVELRKQRRERQISDAKRQDKEVQNTQDLINKFRAKKNKAKFAQTLIRKLDKMEKVEIDDLETSQINFRFPDPPRSGKIVIHADELTKRYGDHLVLNKIRFDLERGEKIAFVGKNGEGKTTLSKIIASKTSYEGEMQLGHNVSIGYFEQNQAETLDGNLTVFEMIDNVATGDMRNRVRNLLGAFLFSGDDIDKKVKVLSGGEKSRLAVAKLLLEPVNLLILDEPTNHLDMTSKNMLKNALKAFPGSLIVVSHDRDFLKGLTDKVYEFRDKGIHQYFGDIYDFLEKRKIDSLDQLTLEAKKSKGGNISDDKAARKELNAKKREFDKGIKRLKNKVNKIEKEISESEQKIATIEVEISKTDFYTTHPNPEQQLKEYNELKTKVASLTDDWETNAMEMELMKEERDELEKG